jgi:cation:H+ antiporter
MREVKEANRAGWSLGAERRNRAVITLIEFGFALLAILVAAALFTNAVETLGERLNLGQGAVGSVLAAVGTALPETMIPMVAIVESVLLGASPEESAEIGVGAILGAPFMLTTLALFVIGVSILASRRRRTLEARVAELERRLKEDGC